MSTRIAIAFILISVLTACTTAPPNFMVFMLDDLGYSDLGCYGGEVETPHMDRLAENGVRFTQMHNCARCCPTRASLMTGMYPHQVGLRFNGRNLSADIPTIAEVMRDNGYQTGMVGKWHLSETKGLPSRQDQLNWLAHQLDSGQFAPMETYPCNRGFDEFWGVIWGVVNYWDPFSLVHNEEAVKTVDEDFYMTDFITEKSVGMIEDFSQNDQPFFLYVAQTAPHWPLHARAEDIQKYLGTFDMGWHALRLRRYERMVDLSLISPEDYPLPPGSSPRLWSEADQDMESQYMAVHAAMIDRVDQGLGEILDKLDSLGELENTIVMVLADNGASPERGYPPGFDRPGFTRDSLMMDYTAAQAGPETSWCYLGQAWANAVNSPFRYWKKESYEGGCATPFIVYWPAGLAGQEGSINRGFGHVMDIFPTCLDIAGIDYPETFNGKVLPGLEGKSMLKVWKEQALTTHDTIFWEHEGGKAIRMGQWKLSALTNEPWELFDMSRDKTESTNLAEQYPERVKEMEELWEQWFAALVN